MRAQLQEPSVDELRRESERNRAKLTNTVEQLSERVTDTVTEVKERLSPSHIKNDVKEYVRDSGEQLFHTLQRKAKDNPLQAAAIGLGLAYPLWGIFKNIPAPILLVGAGLLLSRKAGVGRDALDQAVNKVSDLAGSISTQTSEFTSSVHERAVGAANSVAGTSADASAAVSSAARSLFSNAQSLGNNIVEKAQAAGSNVADAGREFADVAQNTAAEGYETVLHTAAMAKDKAVDAGDRSRDAVMDFVERNPLVVGGLGLAIGAFIAASLPRSDTENRMFGEPSDSLKDQARQTASDGVERAKDAAAGAVGDIATAAAREGFSADGIKETVSGFADSVKSVTDRGLNTALGAATPSQNPTQPYNVSPRRDR